MDGIVVVAVPLKSPVGAATEEYGEMEQTMVTAQATCLRSTMPSFGESCLGVERQLWLTHARPERAMT